MDILAIAIVVGGLVVGLIIALAKQMREMSRLKMKLREMITNVLGSIDFLILTDLANTTFILRDAVISRNYITGYLPDTLQVIQIQADAEFPLQEYVLTSKFADKNVGFIIGSFDIDKENDKVVFKPIIEADKVREIKELPAVLKTIADNIAKTTEAKLKVLEDSLKVVTNIQKLMGAHIKDIVKFVGGLIALRSDYIEHLRSGYAEVSGKKEITEEELWKIISGEEQ